MSYSPAHHQARAACIRLWLRRRIGLEAQDIPQNTAIPHLCRKCGEQTHNQVFCTALFVSEFRARCPACDEMEYRDLSRECRTPTIGGDDFVTFVNGF